MTRHAPVLLEEVIKSLQLTQGMNIIDCTLGDAGHSERILEVIAPKGRLLGIDADPESLLRAKQYLYSFRDKVIFSRNNFTEIKKIALENSFEPVNGILMDLGWSSAQFEDRGRGFSFLKNEPLDMRYGAQAQDVTAEVIVNNYRVEELEKILREYGEEKLSKEISAWIAEHRRKEKIKTTKQLVDIILEAYRKKLKTDKEVPWVGGLHPATKTFQALRIAVNKELEAIKKALPQAVEVLENGGRLAIITFHSLEDRIVKHYFKKLEGKQIKIITKKPIICGEEEYINNPRARSAKLRVAEKI